MMRLSSVGTRIGELTTPPQASPAERAKLQQDADLVILNRQRRGEWSAGVKAHTEYQKRPLEWIVEKLEVPEETIRWSLSGKEYESHEWDGNADPLVTVLESLADGKDVGVESATGVGKTYAAACITLWYLAVFEDSIVITAAPKEAQLFLHVWKEIGKLWPRFHEHFPQAELLTGKIRMKPAQEDRETWAATAFVAGVGADEEVAQKAAGFHSPYMLWITEETPGLHPAFMNTIQHTRTDDRNQHLALGNPDHRNDPLHQFCLDDWVVHLRISALDHPNVVTGKPVVPGAIGRKRLEQRTTKFGKGSRLYGSRIRGISPAEAEDALIKWEWCTQAAAKHDDDAYRAGSLALGVDVANSEHGDKAAIARWQGSCLTEVEDFQCPDASLLGKRVFLEATDKENPIDPRYIGVDSVGVGASTVNKMRELGMKVRHLSGGTRAIPGLDTDLLWSETESDLEGSLKPSGPKVIEAERFDRLRSQIWWRMREDLRLGRIALPPDEDLWQDLCTPTYKTQGGKIGVETKEEIVKRLKRSPNKGDAACYGNFVRRRTPVRKKHEDEVEANRNRDYGLERYFKRHTKRQAKEKQLLERAFARASRRRKR